MKQKGFTLLELIVVVALAGIIVAGVLLNSSLINPHQKFITKTSNIAKLMHHAHQQAEISNENYALSLTKKGYVFLMFQGDSWTPMKQKPLIASDVPKHYKQELIIDNKLIDPLKKDEFTPHILLLASGEMSPFEWTFSDADNGLDIIITGAYNGKVSVQLRYDE